MQPTPTPSDDTMPASPATSTITLARLATGLLQGAVLYVLYRAAQTQSWPVMLGDLFAPLLLVALFAPVLLVLSLGHLDRRQIAIWLATATAVIAALGWYDIWRGGSDYGSWFGRSGGSGPRFPSPLLVFFIAAGFVIAHSLVRAGALDRSRIARYPTYFDMAWKLLIQLAFSMLFVGVLWLVLWLGASMFMLIELRFLQDLLKESWFAIPVTVFAFSCAIHLTDVRPAIVRGIRTLLLVLMSWILPVAVLITAGFLLSLPGTGLAPLWATRHATAVLLGAAAVLVVLINAAFQHGESAAEVARVVRLSARVAACSLLPIVAIAVYSLGLRVNEYGWTSDRIIAAACLLVAACYAIGYAWAACRPAGWLAPVAPVNVAVAFVVLAVLLALFSPLADPARIAVNSQMARLAAGKVKAGQFDYDYLRFEGARYGMAALNELAARAQGAEAALVRDKAAQALKKTTRRPWDEQFSGPVDLAATVTPWPQTAHLPASFLRASWNEREQSVGLPHCLTRATARCDAYLIDFSGDGKPEILLVGRERHNGAAVMMENDAGHWEAAGHLPEDVAGCAPLRVQLQSGAYQTLAPRIRDLEIGEQRIEIAARTAINTSVCAAK